MTTTTTALLGSLHGPNLPTPSELCDVARAGDYRTFFRMFYLLDSESFGAGWDAGLTHGRAHPDPTVISDAYGRGYVLGRDAWRGQS